MLHEPKYSGQAVLVVHSHLLPVAATLAFSAHGCSGVLRTQIVSDDDLDLPAEPVPLTLLQEPKGEVWGKVSVCRRTPQGAVSMKFEGV
ncbi:MULTISPECIES: hypothetical protein [unclassified Streptomyces]|uniref:hypothetical protein n=1 Tax=unclassified Streptomyces TaxID=2593676 RepID=UPI002E143D27|nr:hypothetical protein OG452_20450 [Streptomyces sp. NBC_01197]WSS49796.1 hypothetical protein OG708_14810 [Streptomyces sp. NBC_01180]